ncbi:MAG TPA: hypothetical protein VM286_04740 [Candidatus Thermoplasmatota archaeon]|nr:hypothetical protein [Candidatus Thermoplasmatota archaeon]
MTAKATAKSNAKPARKADASHSASGHAAAHAAPAHKATHAPSHPAKAHKSASKQPKAPVHHAEKAHAKPSAPAKAHKPAKPAKAPKPTETAQNILKRAKPAKVEANHDAVAQVKVRGKAPILAKELLKHVKPAVPNITHDQAEKPVQHAKHLLKQLGKQQFTFNRAYSKATFEEQTFMDFFGPEIEAELESTATIYNDRFARWPCQCCDVVIRVPRRTEVFHGDYHLVHDDVLGLLVNGERWVPNAETPIEVNQPGRIRNPWTGELVKPTRRSV